MSSDRQGTFGSPMRRVAVIGGTFSGNKGAAGMLESVVFNLGRLLPGRCRFDVLSIYPRLDRARDLPRSVRVVAAAPGALVLLLPPLAALYALLGVLRLPRRFLLAFRPLEAIARASILLDVSGISYVDGRGATIIYNLACNLPAIMVGTPVVKLSQAIGPFRSPLTRAAAKLALPRMARIFARGEETARHLAELGLGNVSPAADLAFVLNRHEPVPDPPAPVARWLDAPGPVVGVSPSRVLADYCAARGIDLVEILAAVLEKLHARTGARVLVVAHSILPPGRRSRNNDDGVCRALYERLGDGIDTALVVDDLSPSELRAVIGRCDILVAARFHAMISALCMGVPVLVPAWSHKYEEVMADFGLKEHVIGVDALSTETLLDAAARLLERKDAIGERIGERLPAVTASAWSQMEWTAARLAEPGPPLRVGRKARRLHDRFYGEVHRAAFLGFAADPGVCAGAASGGLVSALLAGELRAGRIDGAIAARAVVRGGRVAFETVLCRTPEEILDCQTSIYSDFDQARRILELLRAEEGSFAAVALPCQWRGVNRFLERHPELRSRMQLRIGLWCGHATDRCLIEDYLRLEGIDLAAVDRFFYRTGLWRGETSVRMTGGAERRLSFRKGYGLLQNLYVDCKRRCFSCPDHFAAGSDVSFGDAWLPELKGAPVKHSMAIAHSERGVQAMDELAREGAVLSPVDPALAVRGQKRAVIWHTYGAAGRARAGRLFGLSIPGGGELRPRWNDYLSAIMILAAWRAYGSAFRPLLLRLPWPVPYAYMLAQKFFLNF